jgi:hypothetical protein
MRVKVASIKCSSAYLRRQVVASRTRFMGSIESGKGMSDAVYEYTNAIKQYRIAILAEIHAYVETS